MKKVYLDTCVLSKLNNSKLELDQLKALDKLSDMDNIDFTSSDKMLEEFLNTSDDKTRMELRVLYKLINKLPGRDTTETQTSFLSPGFPVPTEAKKPLLYKLEKTFDTADAEHIYHAIKGNCDYFLTLDKKSILNKIEKYREKLEEISSGMRYVDPVALLKEIGG